MNYQNISNYLDSQKNNIVRDIVNIVKIPSVSKNSHEVANSLNFILELAKEMGLETRSVLDGQVGIVEIGEGDETIGILAHVDVVPTGDISLWQEDPFNPVIKNGEIWGRGTLDDKGPAIAALYAIKAVEQLGIPFKKKIQLILGTQEEVEWVDMDAYVKEFTLPDYGFTPDGEFPLCNIEKGFADIRIKIPIGDSINGDLTIKSINGGVMVNTIPDKCSAVLEHKSNEITISTMGKAAHSSIPQNGVNAIVNMCMFLDTLPTIDNGLKRAVKLITEKFTDSNCREIGMYSPDEFYNGEYIHRNTAAVTMIYTCHDSVIICFNIRHAYGTNDLKIKNVFEEIANSVGGKIIHYVCKPPVYISKDRPFMKVFADVYDDISGFKNEFSLSYGGSYAKAIPNIVPWGPIFPGELDTCHEENERVSIESILKMSKIYAEALRRMAFSVKSFK